VQQLPLRREDPPDDAVIIIRAGIMERDAVVRSATQCFQGYGVHGISVEAAVNERVDSACANSPRLRRYRQVDSQRWDAFTRRASRSSHRSSTRTSPWCFQT
jgi:hypothetical protein